MRVSEIFTMGRGDDRYDSHYGKTPGYRNYYYDYENEGYYNDNYGGFERGPTHPSLLALIG
ncbi:MAG: hypothetical protein WAN20_07320 [Pseudonocardiaceae bacterium]|jgi:hypothetical protein|nr:hypothetical protein [Pseudonocardiaceae bacterium]